MSKNRLLFSAVLYGIALLSSLFPFISQLSFWTMGSIETSGVRAVLIAFFGLLAGFYFSEWRNSKRSLACNLQGASQ